MFEVYKITFDNNKSYIGYTSKGVMNRLTKHKQNAEGGLDTHFYRAIRKYGLGKIKIKILWRGKNKEEAQQKEKYFIDYYNTYTTGYNQTKGGDGGFSVDNIKEWKRKLSKATTLDRNPKYSGYTDEQIIEKAIDYYIDNNHKLVRRHWTKYSKENGLPQHYSKNRFDGEGYNGFLKHLKEQLNKRKIKFNNTSFILTKEERYNEEFSEKQRRIRMEQIYAKDKKTKNQS